MLTQPQPKNDGQQTQIQKISSHIKREHVMNDIHNILHIDVSPRKTESVTRELTSKVIEQLNSQGATNIVDRDVSSGLPFVDNVWIQANSTPADIRNEDQKHALSLSDLLVNEIQAADTLVIGTPIYNFGIPAALKTWIDMVARVGLTFSYSQNGPIGLLNNKRVILVIASGGTPVGSHIDFATPYLKHVFSFIGIHNVTIIAADSLMHEAEAKKADVDKQIKAL